MEGFDEIDTFEGQHHMALANIPAVGYSVTVEEVKAMAENSLNL